MYMQCTTLAHTTYFHVGNQSSWNKFVYSQREYWATFIRKGVVKKSSGRPVLVTRYEDMKRNQTTEVEEREGEGEERELALFLLHGQSLLLVIVSFRYYASWTF